ncbi:MAG: coxG [Modestobacter sp.]|nr:coxG [Modestobacter sp.]
MQLENSFTVPVPIDEAWRVLMDIERIAPCMPGAALDSVDGDDFTGRVKVKLGPINLTYQGKASFVERDETAHKAVIDARGKDQRGNGTAAAVITAKLAPEGTVTRVDVVTDLNITGRPAQFGRGVMTDVGNKLLGQFADKLNAQLASGDLGLEPAAVDAGAAAASQEPTAATTAGAVEEVAASADAAAGSGPARKATTAAKKTAAAAADKAGAVEATATVPSPTTPPAPSAPTPISAGKKAPSQPPAGTTAPPNKPASGGPARTTPRPAPAEPEPIDLLEVAGGAAMARYAVPAAGGLAVLALLIAIILRRRNR